ncbi:MAG: hypothetical protein JAY63_05430 [Candidatus Thiodiazotropha taylori]|nr:hypothetical protein [Candidatus Thiodiazotropha taylori]
MFGTKQKKRTETDLRQKFTKLGVDELEFCIEDEQDANANPRLAPLVLFHNIWKGVLSKGDNEWFSDSISQFESRQSSQGSSEEMWPEEQELFSALNAVAKSGIDLKHINTLIRQNQESLLQHVAYTLSDCYSDEEEFQDVYWAVFETDKNQKPLRPMNVLHQYYGLVDPEREMEDES